MSYCNCCDFKAENHRIYLKHLGTVRHARRYLEAIKTLENPNQNLVFSQPSKEKVQEPRIKPIKTVIIKKKKKKMDQQFQETTQNNHLEQPVHETTQNNHLDQPVQETTQNNHLDQQVQEITDFVFLDTHFIDLYRTMNIPMHPPILWFIRIFMYIKTFFSSKFKRN